jgi:general secretion pathway protein A
MYQSFYHLNAAPFDVTPNPRYLLLTPTHKEALHMLEYGVRARKGIILLIGDAGTGKTTLLRKALAMKLAASGDAAAECVYINNPRLQAGELFEHLATGFRLPASATVSKPTLLRHLEDRLSALRDEGRSAALIVDEAQALSDELIEELRLLANIESDDAKLLPLVLAGQPELADRLNHHQLRQFKQRIALRCQLSPFTLHETATYIFGRVRLVGGDAPTLFTRDAVEAIHRASKGIPRTISVICDNALLTGFALQRRPVDVAIIDEVCRDFDLSEVSAPADAAAAADVKSKTRSEPEERTDYEAPVSAPVERAIRGGVARLPAIRSGGLR